GSGVAERVRALADRPGADSVFGATMGRFGHRFQLEPPLTATELADLEGRIRVRLPEDYRSFLLEVGRGGAGPYSGHFPLRTVAGRWQWLGPADDVDLDRVADAFPHTEAYNPDDDLEPEPQREQFASEADYEAARQEWCFRADAHYEDPMLVAGTVPLAHQGCGYFNRLIVSGPRRGEIWSDDRACDRGFNPLGTSFGRWYLDWLDRAEKAAG
ncbi:MAG TPA: SMI1/KNR4 family protein, partial [Micromonospora sp.]